MQLEFKPNDKYIERLHSVFEYYLKENAKKLSTEIYKYTNPDDSSDEIISIILKNSLKINDNLIKEIDIFNRIYTHKRDSDHMMDILIIKIENYVGDLAKEEKDYIKIRLYTSAIGFIYKVKKIIKSSGGYKSYINDINIKLKIKDKTFCFTISFGIIYEIKDDSILIKSIFIHKIKFNKVKENLLNIEVPNDCKKEIYDIANKKGDRNTKHRIKMYRKYYENTDGY